MNLEPEVSLFSIFVLGVSLGLTACAVTCLPFIGTWAMGKGEGRKNGLWDTFMFLGGRLVAYASLGALAGFFGAWFVRELAAGAGNLLIGLTGLFAAASLIWPKKTDAHKTVCSAARSQGTLPPFFLGIGLTLIPCAPLATLLAAAAAANSPLQGLFFGFVFGLGTAVTPMLVFIPVMASIGQKLRAEHAWLTAWLRAGAAIVLATLSATRIDLFATNLSAYLLAIVALILCWAHLRKKRAVIMRTYPHIKIQIAPKGGVQTDVTN